MRRLTIAAATAVAMAGVMFAAGMVRAGADRIAFPTDFQKTYKLYGIIDRPDSKQVSHLYVDRASLKAAKYGQPVPDGTTLVMTFGKVKLGADGEPVVDKDGRMIPDGAITGVAVQKKGKGWGADHSDKQQNGDWEYAVFLPDGSRNPKVQSFDACFGCHSGRAKPEEDYTFLFAPYLHDHKKG